MAMFLSYSALISTLVHINQEYFKILRSRLVYVPMLENYSKSVFLSLSIDLIQSSAMTGMKVRL